MDKQTEKRLSANTHLSKKKVILYNFLGGLSWGFGSIVGASLVVAILGAILHQLGFFDPVSNFLQSSQIMIKK